MMNRILFACLFLALSTESSSLSCRWMDDKFRQHNEETLNLLDTMAKNSTNTTEVEVTVAFPNHLYHQVSKSSAEDKLAFTVQILEEVAALFEEDHSSASWEDSTLALECCTAKCNEVNENSTSKSKAMVLSQKRVDCPLVIRDEFLPRVEEFKYLGVLFSSDGRRGKDIDRQISAAAAVLVHQGEERAECKGKALSLLVILYKSKETKPKKVSKVVLVLVLTPHEVSVLLLSML
nr:PREDICTED: uncharacterized protein LOC102198589 [Pundamilia nyererei]